MARSIKKGAFVDDHLSKKVAALNATREKKVVSTILVGKRPRGIRGRKLGRSPA